MSNIRGLNDINQNQGNNANRENRYREAFSSSSNDFRDARNESFCAFLKSIFCRKLKLISFTSIMAAILVIFYIATLCWGIESSVDHFLVPNSKGPIMTALRKDAVKLRQGEIWRLITYSFLHGYFEHIFLNTIILIIFSSALEALVEWKKTLIVYTISGILGALFSSLINNSNAVGASCCIYGIIGAYVSFLLILACFYVYKLEIIR